MQKFGCKRMLKLPIFFPNVRGLADGSLSGVQKYDILI